MPKYQNINHVAINTNDMEATLRFYCGMLGMRLLRTSRTANGRRHYNVEIGGGNAFAIFDGAEMPPPETAQCLNHLAMNVDTVEEFDEVHQRLKENKVEMTEVMERGTGKTFFFHDPNGIRLQLSVQTKERHRAPGDPLDGDSDPVPFVRELQKQA